MSLGPIAESISTASKTIRDQCKKKFNHSFITSADVAEILSGNFMYGRAAKDDYNKFHKGKFYSWHTHSIKLSDSYNAFGPKITAEFIQASGESEQDIIDYMSKHSLFAESEYFRPDMKGGHRDNAYMNSVTRKLHRSKALRRKVRKQRNVTRQFVKTNKGPVGINFAFRYLYKDVKNADDVVKAAWETVPTWKEPALSQVKKVKTANSAPVTKLSDQQGKLMCTPF